MTAAALPLLVGLGVWQLQRAEWKVALLARLDAAPRLPPLELSALPGGNLDFRRASGRCAGDGLAVTWEGGLSAAGQPGYVARVLCPAIDGQPAFAADLGWTSRPDWSARTSLDARIAGLLRDFGSERAPRLRLVAAHPPPGLGLLPATPPTLAEIPNNHRSYAVQWFSFAAILAAVYVAFVLRWRRGG